MVNSVQNSTATHSVDVSRHLNQKLLFSLTSSHSNLSEPLESVPNSLIQTLSPTKLSTHAIALPSSVFLSDEVKFKKDNLRNNLILNPINVCVNNELEVNLAKNSSLIIVNFFFYHYCYY